VKGILPDGEGNLWLSTDKGLSRFEPKTQMFRNYTKKDGLHHNVFLSGAYHRGRDGRFYFGGESGVTAFHPDSIKAKRCVSPVVLTSFKVFDQSLPLPRSLASTREIRLSYKQNFFSFESAVLDYSIPEKNQYAYMLEGFDRDWIHAGVRRYASYTNVPPGEYVLRVKGANSDGVWNEGGVAVKITITPPLWETWWFTGLFGVALLVTIGGTIRYIEIRKLRERLRELEKQQALERERLRISQDVHDEVGAGLTQIAILSELAKIDLKRPQAAEAHIQKISERARQVIDNIGEIIWAINPKHDQLGDLAAYLRHYAVQFLMTTSIKYHCEFSDSSPDIHLSAEARRNLFLVFKEALHNIVKHAAATEVVLRLTCTDQRREILICDNGRGFSPEHPAPGVWTFLSMFK
jgi:signal transduction histidine kinase